MTTPCVLVLGGASTHHGRHQTRRPALPAGMPDAGRLGGDAELMGDLGLASILTRQQPSSSSTSPPPPDTQVPVGTAFRSL